MIAPVSDAKAIEPKAKVFISYSRKDIAFADRLEAGLKARGFEPLIDRSDIYAFEDWWKRIEALIGQSDTVVFVLSPDSVASDVALKEVAHAASLNKRFAPIVCRTVEDSAVPETLRRLNFIVFDDPDRFEESVETLAIALETDLNWIRQHTEYGEAQRRWLSAGRPKGLLLQSPTLDHAEYWLASRPRNAPEPTEEIRSYVLASRKRARASQRLSRVVLVSTFAFMAATILGLVGWINQTYIYEQWRWYSIGRPFMTASVRPYVLNEAAESALKAGDTFRECASDSGKDYCPGMVVVPPGSFLMGSPPTENGRNTDEGPQHSVTIARAFAVSRFQLTFAELDTCIANGNCALGAADMGWGRVGRPAFNTNWDDAQRYVAWLSKVTGKPYRLLTEAEYEYATRAGTTTAYPWGESIGENNANCSGCGSKLRWGVTTPVGSFPANGFGLYDMVGNVFEWTEDCYNDSYNGAPKDGSAWKSGDCYRRVARGGADNRAPEFLRSATRHWFTTDSRINILGFRVARMINQ